MLVPQVLLETLEKLTEHEFTKFKWYLALNVLNNLEQMAKCYLESPHRHEIVTRMIESHGEKMAVTITVEILKRMQQNNTAKELQKTYADGAAAEENVSHPLLTSSSSALDLPTGQKISACGARGAVAPGIITATNGSVIIIGSGTASVTTAPTVCHHFHFYQN